jgi:preprotein translocase subunit YajC
MKINTETAAILIVVLYFILGIVTFAYRYQRYNSADYEKEYEYTQSRDIGSVVSGAVWPIYWVGKFAFYITKPQEKEPIEKPTQQGTPP